ncbi:uncharacterized protein LOC120212012 [Hibiscus syriacus]|uniref:uncharacterized protein LOC120212012 n=1 Tax=Hibiscus syriacus TaxID=106335 RepID=UPI0019205351|nr:uncharacterized protein LOC120212012 [Hibiscus syriacus]
MSYQVGVATPHHYISSRQKPRQDAEQASVLQSVETGIFNLRTAILAFDSLVNYLGTLKDTVELRDKLHKTRLDIEQLVKESSAKLRESRETDQVAEPLKKYVDDKLAVDFQATLEGSHKVQRLAAGRETVVSTAVPEEVLPSSYDVYELERNPSKSLAHQQLLVTKKVAKNREEEAEKRAKAAAHRAKSGLKKVNRVEILVPEVTEAELHKQREEQQAPTLKKVEKEKHSMTAAEEESERMLLVTKKNRDDSLVKTRNVEETSAQSSEAVNQSPNRHSFNYWWKKDYPKISNGYGSGCFTLYIENLPEKNHWKRFGSLFCPFGQIMDAFIPTKINSKGFRFGFIRFATIGEARKAISMMNGARIDGRKIGVSFAKFNPRHSFWRKSSSVVHLKPEREDVTRNNLYSVDVLLTKLNFKFWITA